MRIPFLQSNGFGRTLSACAEHFGENAVRSRVNWLQYIALSVL